VLTYVPCNSAVCEDGNPPSSFVVLLDGDDGSPLAAANYCGPCAAAFVVHTGAVVKSRPTTHPVTGRLRWPLIEVGTVDPDRIP
jgi:hypothetical protein